MNSITAAGTQSHANLLVEGNHFLSVGKSGVEGSGFSSASSVPRATQAAFLRNSVHGTNSATGPHVTEWCNTTVPGIGTEGYNGWCNRTGWGPKAHPGNPLETMTSDGSYGGYFGAASVDPSDMSKIMLAGDIANNTEGRSAQSPAREQSPVESWRHAAMVVVQGPGLGQIRTVVGGTGAAQPRRGVQLDRPLTTALGEGSVRFTPLKNGGDHSFGSRFGPLRNRPPVFWRRLLDSWRQDGENSEKTEKKASKMGEIQPSKKSAGRRPICDG